MRNSNKRWSLRAAATGFAALTAAMVLSGTARADVVYYYAGPDFTNSDGTANGLTDPESDNIAGYFDFASALGPDYDTFPAEAPVSWSFFDGVNTLSSADGDDISFLFLQTDDNAVLIDWNITLETPDGNLIMTMNTGGGSQGDGLGDPGSTVPNYELTSTFGVGSAWNPGPDGATFSTAAPEPSSVFLFGAGLLALAVLPRRKLNR